MKIGKGERCFYSINTLFMIFMIVITAYPMLFVVFGSFSDPTELAKRTGLLFAPAGFSFEGYQKVFGNPNIYIGYRNTIFYVFVGVAVNMIMTIIGAYGLSRKNLMLKKPIMILITITMFFGGGLIPSYLLVKDLGMLNSMWALIIPSALSTWNLFVLKTAFSTIPEGLLESARIDGAKEMRILIYIVIPTSMASIAAITMFYAVGRWNEWFSAMLYLQERTKYPLQLFLRELLIIPQSSDGAFAAEMIVSGSSGALLKEVIKYCTIMVSTVPILLCYPFFQKYFVKGVMLGSIKE